MNSSDPQRIRTVIKTIHPRQKWRNHIFIKCATPLLVAKAITFTTHKRNHSTPVSSIYIFLNYQWPRKWKWKLIISNFTLGGAVIEVGSWRALPSLGNIRDRKIINYSKRKEDKFSGGEGKRRPQALVSLMTTHRHHCSQQQLKWEVERMMMMMTTTATRWSVAAAKPTTSITNIITAVATFSRVVRRLVFLLRCKTSEIKKKLASILKQTTDLHRVLLRPIVAVVVLIIPKKKKQQQLRRLPKANDT